MNLCIDVGNTTIGVGFFKEEKLFKRLTFTVDTKKTKDEYISVIKRTLEDSDIASNEVTNIIFSSVVPSINEPLTNAVKEVFSVEPMLIAPGLKTGLPIRVDNPNEVGNDLVAVLVGAKEKYSYPCLIADLGTASKILLLDKNGCFVSCLIMPGLSLSASSLTNRAALLPEVELKTPKNIMAKNTIDALTAGIIYGHADMIKGAIDRYEKEIGYKCTHVLTGGNAVYIKGVIEGKYEYSPNLCLEGLNLILNRNEGMKNEK